MTTNVKVTPRQAHEYCNAYTGGKNRHASVRYTSRHCVARVDLPSTLPEGVPLRASGPSAGLADASGWARLARISQAQGKIFFSRPGAESRTRHGSYASTHSPLRFRRRDSLQ